MEVRRRRVRAVEERSVRRRVDDLERERVTVDVGAGERHRNGRVLVSRRGDVVRRRDVVDRGDRDRDRGDVRGEAGDVARQVGEAVGAVEVPVRPVDAGEHRTVRRSRDDLEREHVAFRVGRGERDHDRDVLVGADRDVARHRRLVVAGDRDRDVRSVGAAVPVRHRVAELVGAGEVELGRIEHLSRVDSEEDDRRGAVRRRRHRTHEQRSPSTSESFASTSIARGTSSETAAVSSAASGASLTGSTVICTVATFEKSAPSRAR